MLPDLKAPSSILAMLLLIASAALLLLLHLYEPVNTGLWAQIFFNSMHVPVFGIVALSLYLVTATQVSWGFSKRAGVVLAIVFGLSILSEAAQIPGPRDASVQDLVSDWLGAIAVLLFAHALNMNKAVSRNGRIMSAVIGTSVVLVALSSLIGVSAAYAERYYQRPVIASFDTLFGQFFRRTQHASLRLVNEPISDWTIGQITLDHGPWPGIIFHDIWPDWRSYSTLILNFELDSDVPLDINVRVHDRDHGLGDQRYDDRFNRTVTLQQGQFTLRIPLQEIRDAPKTRKMDLSQINGIAVFCSGKDEGREFLLAEIRLQ